MADRRFKPILGKIYRNVNTNSLLTVVYHRREESLEVWRKITPANEYRDAVWYRTKLEAEDIHHMLEKEYLTDKGTGKYERARARIQLRHNQHSIDTLWIDIPNSRPISQ